MSEPLIPPSPSAEAYAIDEDQGDVFTINDPFALFADWLATAGEHEPNDPNAMTLATVDSDGAPDARIVLLKDVDACGLTFYTNIESAKGRELAATPKAALVFHWKTIRRQVRFRGDVRLVENDEADAYFATRARGAQIGAWASKQSRVMESRANLKKAVAEFEARFDGKDVPRPPHWSGYQLIPTEIEFWVNRPYRLHDRLYFHRLDEQSEWERNWLQP